MTSTLHRSSSTRLEPKHVTESPKRSAKPSLTRGRQNMNRTRRVLAPFFIAMLLVFACWAAKVHAGGNVAIDDSPAVAPAADFSTDYILVKLQDAPLASYEGGVNGIGRTKPLNGKFNLN